MSRFLILFSKFFGFNPIYKTLYGVFFLHVFGTFPIDFAISIARTRRTLLCLSIFFALVGSSFWSIEKSIGADLPANIFRSLGFGGTSGKEIVPSKVSMYRPVPPTIIGNLFCTTVYCSAFSANILYCATENWCLGFATSIRWWGTLRISRFVIFPVPRFNLV